MLARAGAEDEEDDTDAAAPGLALIHATHVVSCPLFSTIHNSHSHTPSAFLNLSPKPRTALGAVVEVDRVLASETTGRVSNGFTPVPGLAVSQATHFTASGLFWTKHVSQSHVPAGVANSPPNP